MINGFEMILPFLKPIEHLILDDSISEVMVNGSERVFIERNGFLERVPNVALSERALMVAVKNIARRLGDDISESKPILDSRLPDGSRVAVVIPPCSLGGVTLTIRRFNTRHFQMEDLITAGTLDRAVANLLEDRTLVIEDTAEIHLVQQNLVRFEARREQNGLAAVSIRDLLKASLRHRPDRILLGEIRGGEAFDLLQLLNTGHSGTLSTIHANSARQGLARFTSCVLQSGVDLPYRAVKINIADSLNVVVHIERRPGRRYVSEILEINGYDPDTDLFDYAAVFLSKRDQA